MVSLFPNLAPNEAWAPYRPSDDQPWDHRRAAHLFRRAGFSAPWSVLEAAVGRDPADVVADLFTADEAARAFQVESDSFANTILASGDPKQLSAWWVYVMLGTPRPLLEKSTLFWHGHFATSAAKVEDATAMYRQNRLLRQHALGNFAEMVHAISRDPAMLIYLDSVTNRKAHPNENYARELMELFCLGEGHYTEQDIRELARCFTGWEIRRGKFRFNRYQHDFGEKQVLGETGTLPDGAAIDVVLRQPAGPQFIAGKLVRYFVLDEPELEPEWIAPLAHDLHEQDWNVAPVLQRMLSSQLFFSDAVIGRKIRSPVDLLVGLLRALEGTTNTHELGQALLQLGHGLFYPPNVKGWDGGRTWINSSTLLGRANAVRDVLQNDATRFGRKSLTEYFEQQGATTGKQIVERLMQVTVAVAPPTDVQERLAAGIDGPEGTKEERIAESIHTLTTLPEFQLC